NEYVTFVKEAGKPDGESTRTERTYEFGKSTATPALLGAYNYSREQSDHPDSKSNYHEFFGDVSSTAMDIPVSSSSKTLFGDIDFTDKTGAKIQKLNMLTIIDMSLDQFDRMLSGSWNAEEYVGNRYGVFKQLTGHKSGGNSTQSEYSSFDANNLESLLNQNTTPEYTVKDIFEDIQKKISDNKDKKYLTIKGDGIPQWMSKFVTCSFELDEENEKIDVNININKGYIVDNNIEYDEEITPFTEWERQNPEERRNIYNKSFTFTEKTKKEAAIDRNTIIIICSAVGGALLFIILIFLVKKVISNRNNDDFY
ncbi:MAG: hypothetical protein ACRC4M_02490, partial [Mycoplasma sp.]